MERFARSAIATSTHKQYELAWKLFKEHAAVLRHPFLPCSVLHAQSILAHIALHSESHSTCLKVAASVAFFHRLHGHSSPTDSSSFKMVLKGIKRTYIKKTVRVSPITTNIVQNIVYYRNRSSVISAVRERRRKPVFVLFSCSIIFPKFRSYLKDTKKERINMIN